MDAPSPEPSVVVNNYFQHRSEKMAHLHDVFSAQIGLPTNYRKQKHAEQQGTTKSWKRQPVERQGIIKEQKPLEQQETSSSDFMREQESFNRYLDHVSSQLDLPEDFDIKTCDWAQVMVKLMEAKSALNQRVERDKTWLSKGGAALTRMSNMFHPVLQAIPDELCFLHGGLALVLHLAKGRDKVKGEIVSTFEELTCTFAAAATAVEYTNPDHRLNEALDNLRMALFKTIPTLIHILNPQSPVSYMAAPFRTENARQLLETIRVAMRRVEQRAATLTDHLHSHAARITKDHVKGIHDSVQDLHAMQQHIRDMVNDALAGQDGLAKMLADAVKVFNHHRRESSRKHQPGWDEADIASSTVPDSKLFTLLWILDADPEHVAEDLLFVRRQTKQFDVQSRHTAAVIFNHLNFQRWMTTDSSDLLHIEGRLDSSSFGKTSPISYFCATLVDKMDNMPPQAHTLALSFFCGQHTASNDPLCGPRGLLRSLIDQSLRAWEIVSLEELDLSALENTSHRAISTKDLCGLLQFVINQIPASYTIYCVIDDINSLEREGWEDDFWVLMETLEQMVSGHIREDSSCRARFKTIITSPGRSYWLRGDRAVNINNHVLVCDR